MEINVAEVAAAAKSLQSCPTLCDPIDGSPPGSPVPGILQARTLEWVAISFSNAWKWKVKVRSLSHVRLFATPWTAAHQAPPSVGFSRQEYWSGVSLPSPDWSRTPNKKKRPILLNSYSTRTLLVKCGRLNIFSETPLKWWLVIEKPVITFKNPDAYQNYLGIFWKIQMPRYLLFSPKLQICF